MHIFGNSYGLEVVVLYYGSKIYSLHNHDITYVLNVKEDLCMFVTVFCSIMTF